MHLFFVRSFQFMALLHILGVSTERIEMFILKTVIMKKEVGITYRQSDFIWLQKQTYKKKG